METRENYRKKMKLYEKLGAKKFQKVVFAIENTKWKIIRKAVPNYLKYVDKYIEKQKKKELKFAKTEEQRQQAIDNAVTRKMAVRREYVNSSNLNYHINEHEPSEIINQLEWNKDIHKKGMISDLIALPLLIGAGAIGITPAFFIAGYEAFSLFINFECVNIQNYNICRYKILEDRIKRKEAKEIQRKIAEYNVAFENVNSTIKAKEDLPTMEEIADNIKTKEQALIMKKFLLEMKQERENKAKTFVKGEK